MPNAKAENAGCKAIFADERIPRNVTLARATLGHSGSNAPGDGTMVPSLSGEAHTLQGWEYVTPNTAVIDP